jgi:hypothetical protein
MNRSLISTTALAACLTFGVISAKADPAVETRKSPKEIEVASEILAKKYDDCRHEAKQLKLSFLKRRIYIHDCVRKPDTTKQDTQPPHAGVDTAPPSK